MPLGDRRAKEEEHSEVVFRNFSLGIVSARDSYVFNFSRERLVDGVKKSIEAYGEALAKYKASRSLAPVDSLVDVEDSRIKWSRQTKRLLH
jgi:predicted helicase